MIIAQSRKKKFLEIKPTVILTSEAPLDNKMKEGLLLEGKISTIREIPPDMTHQNAATFLEIAITTRKITTKPSNIRTGIAELMSPTIELSAKCCGTSKKIILKKTKMDQSLAGIRSMKGSQEIQAIAN